PTGAEPATQLRPGDLLQPPFQRAVHVLVGRCRRELAGGDQIVQPVQRGEQVGVLLFGQQAGRPQRLGVGPGAGQVVPGQPPVELGGPAEREHRLGRTTAEPAAPELPRRGRRGVGGHQSLPSSRAASSSASPSRAAADSSTEAIRSNPPDGSSPNSVPCSTSTVPCCSGCSDRKSTRLNSSHVKISYAVF